MQAIKGAAPAAAGAPAPAGRCRPPRPVGQTASQRRRALRCRCRVKLPCQPMVCRNTGNSRPIRNIGPWGAAVLRRRCCSPRSWRPRCCCRGRSAACPAAARRTPRPKPATPRWRQQPLTGVGAGETIREVSQATPFSLVALTGVDAATTARVRASKPDGSWGPWYQAMPSSTRAPTAAALPAAPNRCSSVAPPRCRLRSTAQPRRPRPPRRRSCRTAEPPRLSARDRRAAVRAERQRRADLAAAGPRGSSSRRPPP